MVIQYSAQISTASRDADPRLMKLAGGINQSRTIIYIASPKTPADPETFAPIGFDEYKNLVALCQY